MDIPASLDGHPVTALATAAFYALNAVTRVTIPDSVVDIEGNPFIGCPDLTEIVVSPEHPALQTVDGVLFSRADHRLVCYPQWIEDDTCIVPEGTEIIGDTAFYYCGYPRRIVLPKSIKAIGVEAFNWCSHLREINLPEGLITLGEGAFRQCLSLTRLTLPRGIVHIPDMAFWGSDVLTELTLPADIISIGEQAFGACNGLTELTVPRSVAYIGSEAFGDQMPLVYPDSFAWRYCRENSIHHAELTADGQVGRVWQAAQIDRCDAWISLRAEPSTKAMALAQIPLGAQVLISDADGVFLRCCYDGLEGYVLVEYIDII